MILLSFGSLAQSDAEERSLLIPLNPKKGEFIPATDIQKAGGVAFTKEDYQNDPNIEYANPHNSPYWKKVAGNRRKLSFSLNSQVVDASCVDCFESLPGMFQIKVKDQSGGKYRLTLHREMKANLFRFHFIHELGYQLPKQSFFPHMRINFSDASEKEFFKTRLKIQFAHGSGRTWKSWITKEGPDWVQVKDGLIEMDANSESNEVGYHWLGFNEADIKTSRALRGLLIPLLMTDWGENLNIVANQFIRKSRGYLFIKHPFAHIYKDIVHISDLKWMTRKILLIQETQINRALQNMNLSSDEVGRKRSQIIAILNYFKETLFSKEEQAMFPDSPTSHIVDRGASIPALKKNWRFYVMLGVDRLARLATDQLESLSRVEWNKTLKNIGNEQKNEIRDFLRGEDDQKAYPLTLGTFARAGLKLRYSRDLVRGQFYGNTDLANLADTMIYGAGAQVGVSADVFGELPFRAYKSFRFERQVVHLKPVQSLDAASKKFWSDSLLPVKIRQWRKYFREAKCKYNKRKDVIKSLDCSQVGNALKRFSDDFKLNETLILTTDISYPWGYSLGLPRTDFLYGVNLFRGSRVGGEHGRSNIKRYTMRSTDNGLQIIITDSTEKFRRHFLKLKFGLTIADYSTRKTKADPETKIYNIDYKTMNEKDLVDAFLAIQGILVYRDTSYLERYFEAQVIKNKVNVKRTNSPVYLTNLVPREKDYFEVGNNVTISSQKGSEQAQLRLFEDENLNEFSLASENDDSRNLLLLKTVSRKFWDWEGMIEDLLRTLRIPIRLRSIRDGENAGDIRRSAHIKVAVTEADLTDQSRGLFEPVVILKDKYIAWKASGKKVKRQLAKLSREYSGIHDDVSFDELNKKDIERMKQFEINQVIVLKTRFIEKLANFLTQSNKNTLENWSDKADVEILTEVNRFKRKNEIDSMGKKLRLVHKLVQRMMKKMSFPEIIRFFNSEDIEHDIQIQGWKFKSGVEKPEFVALSLTKNAEIGESVFSRIVRQLGLPEYEIRGSYMTFGF